MPVGKQKVGPVGPWWRVLPDVWAHRLNDRGLISPRMLNVACRWRGNHGFRFYAKAAQSQS